MMANEARRTAAKQDDAHSPRISVIVPVYNVEDYLERCLDSLAAQTLTDIEIVCVNDGSTDGSCAILERRQEQDPRIVIVDKPNGGVSSARNAGIQAARAPYVCFLDSDDRFMPNACARMAETLEQTDADVLTFGGLCYPPEASYPWLEAHLSLHAAEYNGFAPALLFEENAPPFAWRCACRRSFLAEHAIFFDETMRIGEDQLWFFELYPQSRKTILIPDKLYEYRVVREGSLMSQIRNDAAEKCTRNLAIMDKVLQSWEKQFKRQRYNDEITDWLIAFALYGIFCLPEPSRSHLLKEFSQSFRRFWGPAGLESLTLPKAQLALLDAALGEKPVGNVQALVLRARYFVGKYGFKAVVGKLLGMN